LGTSACRRCVGHVLHRWFGTFSMHYSSILGGPPYLGIEHVPLQL
jgi:hypothetical protein